MTSTSNPRSGTGLILSFAFVVFVILTWVSSARWANFEYRTFDLAYYVQALWQLIHGRFQVSVEGVPLLGNHVEPIVFLFTPFFLIFRHPLLFVWVQNAAIASMGPVAFSIGKRLGLNQTTALLLGVAVLITPATGYIALHEFHPEALTAPFLLLMLRAHLRRSLSAYWIWLMAAIACKENIALIIAAYCTVQIFLERKRSWTELRVWYLLPLALSVVWFLVCVKLITPALNSGSIDYLALYDRLGTSPSDILVNAITQPDRIFRALSQSLLNGNLFWALLLPFLGIPLLRPHWLLIAAPILLQHLLSWRSSEWVIYFHYAAPLLPLFWIALAEGIGKINRWASVPVAIRSSLPFLVILACVVAQIMLGPAGAIAKTAVNWFDGEDTRIRKQTFIGQIPPDASVLAPLPYLSHLAMRENLFSLHYVLKGLKTLSRSPYSPPPPTDFVLIDYNDSATFDPVAGYYHPKMKTVDDRVIPSSDLLLHDFLKQRSWTILTSNELTLLRQGASTEKSSSLLRDTVGPIEISPGSELTGITKSSTELGQQGLEIKTSWNFQESRQVFPWMFLRLTPRGQQKAVIISHGLCAPEVTQGLHQEMWQLTPSSQIPIGDYDAEVAFVDNSKSAWAANSSRLSAKAELLSRPISIGELKVTSEKAEVNN